MRAVTINYYEVYNWVKVGTVTLKWAAAVSRRIPRICRGEPRNLANGAGKFGKICRGKLWSLIFTIAVIGNFLDFCEK